MADGRGGRARRVAVGSVGELAAAVRSRREELGLSIVQVADLAGASRFFVSDLERGKPSIQMDKALAVVAALSLGIEVRTVSSRASRPGRAPTSTRGAPQIALERAHDDPETIGCAECGAHVRDLPRHLATAHAMRTTEYRKRWALGPRYDLRPRAVAERAARRSIARALLRYDTASDRSEAGERKGPAAKGSRPAEPA